MKRKIYSILLTVIILLNSFAYADIGIEENVRSYILAETNTGEILESYNIDEVVEIASISKIMTYTVVMDSVSKGDISLEDVIVIDKDTQRINGSTFKLKEGETFTVKELLEASLVISGNDATYALAKHVAGTEQNFAKLMNEKASEIGLKNAVFYNSTGLPIYPQDIQNQMTTKELFQLSNYIIEYYPEILEISRLKAISMASRDFFQWNSNPLIPKISEVDGLKTGFTNRAGYCHVSTFKEEAKKGDRDELRLIAIVMGAKDFRTRNKMSETLVRYGLNNYAKKVFLDPDVPLDKMYFEKGEVQEISVFPASRFSQLVKADENIEVTMNMREDIKLPIKKDQVLGVVKVVNGKTILYESEIITKDNLNKAKWHVIFGRTISELIIKIKKTFAIPV